MHIKWLLLLLLLLRLILLLLLLLRDAWYLPLLPLLSRAAANTWIILGANISICNLIYCCCSF